MTCSNQPYHRITVYSLFTGLVVGSIFATCIFMKFILSYLFCRKRYENSQVINALPNL